MTDYQFTLFDTALGSCGIAWSDKGIAAVQLPESDVRATRARIAGMLPGAVEAPPPARLRKTIAALADLLDGKEADLSTAVLDMERVSPFHRKVYQATRTIPAGDTLSYGEIAARAGSPGAARAVGQALGRNPFALIVPCHRVVAAGGKLGGFSANGGVVTKAHLLRLENRS
ncbi:methylated-DNA--[protein]-cysteine S-methyltransferase [Allorhizocola rhizosphaerae]|uniref:methylated-DNA--[protein]-cysteine S-methyltransferase n=1 Tax=Allorhizocola rhizosphaerae TaxID=1872709 RepID=UPI000E3DC2C9|nr:methylated-DNA--[protein]-cysteine S-methyltransferase [Allorhizocola rhizosphaerae]